MRTTSIKVTKTRAAEYRSAKNPDFKVRTVRHGRKAAEYFIDVQHLPSQKVELVKHDARWGLYIAKTTKLRNGEIREITLPYNNTKIEKFIEKAEKDPDKVNALKDEGDLFGFTVEGHRVQTTFKSAASMQKLIQAYRNTGSKDARISIFRIKKRSDWVTRPTSVAAIKRRRLVKEPRRQMTMPLLEAREHEADRKLRYYHRVKQTAHYKEKHRQRQANYRKRLRKGRTRR